MAFTESPFEEVGPDKRLPKRWQTLPEERERPPLTPGQRRLRWRATLVVMGVAVLLLLFWWWWQPRSYRLVARFDGVDAAIFPCANGFLIRGPSNRFVLHDWRGKTLWTVNATGTGLGPLIFSIAPNGRNFAALLVDNKQARLQVWHDGNTTFNQTVAIPLKAMAGLRAMDDGRVFVWHRADMVATPALVVQDNRVIARGRLLPGMLVSVSPDGKAVISVNGSGFDYAAISLNKDKIALSHQYAGTDQVKIYRMRDFYLDLSTFNAGVVLANNGAVYNAGGKIAAATGWMHESVSPNGLYTYEQRGSKARIFSPVTGKSWRFKVGGEHRAGDATWDGQYGLAWIEGGLSPEMRDGLREVPLFGKLTDTLPSDTLILYQRGGRRRAVLHAKREQWWHGVGQPQEWWWYPSPDGRALVYNMAGSRSSQCLLFRW